MSNRQCGATFVRIAEDERNGEVKVTLCLCPCLTNRLSKREREVEVLSSSPTANKFSVDQNRMDLGPLSALLPSEL